MNDEKARVWWIIALMMEIAETSETLVNFYETTQRCNPEDDHRSIMINYLVLMMIETSVEHRPQFIPSDGWCKQPSVSTAEASGAWRCKRDKPSTKRDAILNSCHDWWMQVSPFASFTAQKYMPAGTQQGRDGWEGLHVGAVYKTQSKWPHSNIGTRGMRALAE